MPLYEIEDRFGRVYEVEGDEPPTDTEIDELIGSLGMQELAAPPPPPLFSDPRAEDEARALNRQQMLSTTGVPDRSTLPENLAQAGVSDWLAQGGFGLQQGFADLGRQGHSVAQALFEPVAKLGPVSITPGGLRPTGMTEWLADFFRESAGVAGEQAQAVEEVARDVPGPEFARKLTRGATSLIPAVAAGPLGIPGVVAASGLQQGGSTLAEAQDAYERQGVPTESPSAIMPNRAFWKAAAPAAIDAAQTAAITFVAGKIFGPGAEGLTMPAKREAIKGVVKQAVGEAVEEGTQQLISDAVIAKLSYNPEMTFAEALAQAKDAALIGGILGGGVTAARGGLNTHLEREAENAEMNRAVTESANEMALQSTLPQAAQRTGTIPDLRPPNMVTPEMEAEIQRGLASRSQPPTPDALQPQSQGGPADVRGDQGRAEAEAPLNPGGALADLTPELQARSNSVQDQMKAEFMEVKGRQAASDLDVKYDGMKGGLWSFTLQDTGDTVQVKPGTPLPEIQAKITAKREAMAGRTETERRADGQSQADALVAEFLAKQATPPLTPESELRQGGGVKAETPQVNPAASIIPEGFVDFDIFENPKLGLREPPAGVETIPSGPLPEGTIYKPVGKGYNGNRPATYAFTPDGKVYSDSNRTMTHGGASPWTLSYVTKWFGESRQPTPPAPLKAQEGGTTEPTPTAAQPAAPGPAETETAGAIAAPVPLTPEAQPDAEVGPGMGAAKPEEFQPPVPFKTSNKNATVDAERKARGLPPMMDTARQANQTAWDEAMSLVDENPAKQDELIAELAQKPRAVTPTENALLLHRRIDLRNEYEKALYRWKKAFESDDVVLAAEESQRVKDWSSRLSDLEDITKRTGAESGRSLQARKMMAREDYSLAKMELKAMEAKGRNLTSEEHLQLIRARDRIAELERKIEELESGKEGREVTTQTDETMREVSKDAKGEATSKDFDIDREENLLGKIRAKIDKGQQEEITPLVQQLARMFWRRGIRTREPMIEALHGALKTILPDFTVEETRRAFSGYGNYKALSKEEIDVGLRDLRGQTQQVLKLEALEARKPLEKTGVERREPSDEERRLIKQVNELKRRYGVVVTDPATQLKSALAARKTYYEHRIADLKHEIETRQKIVKTKSASPTDPELDALIAEHERLKTEHEQIFTKPDMTDEQRLKLALSAATRNQAQWESRLENAEKGIFDKRVPGRKVTSPELELIQAETAAMREHVKELQSLDTAVIEAKRVNSLERQKATLEKQIAEQERKLSEGDLASPGQRISRPADPALEELLQKRDALNKQMAEARKKPEAQKYAEAQARELARLNKAIDERQAKIAAGDISTGTKPKQNRPLSPELEQAKQQLEMVNEQMAALRKAARPVKTAEERALQSLKTRMKNREADFRRRIAEKDFTKRTRKPVPLDAEALKLKANLDAAKADFDNALASDRWARMSVFAKAKRGVVDTYDAARALITTGEFGYLLRQGKMTALSRPIQTARAIPDMFRALMSTEQGANEIDAKVQNDPLAPEARTAGLHLPESDASLHKQEEAMMGRWVGKVPVVKHFNQSMRVFLNRIRLDTWKAMRKSMSKSGTPTVEEDRQIAMFVNESTGRGGLGKLELAAVPLARVMFAPRYYASRLQLAAGHSLWGGTMRTRRVIAMEYARSLIGLGLYYSMLIAAFKGDGEDEEGKERGRVELDPRSTDFGKVQIENSRIDPLAGLAQIITLAARTATGEKKTTTKREIQPIRGPDVPFGGDQWSDIMARHLRGKLHPVPASIANLFDGSDLGGDESTVLNQAGRMVAPITYIDIYVALREHDLPEAIALSLLAMLGDGLQTFEEREKKKK